MIRHFLKYKHRYTKCLLFMGRQIRGIQGADNLEYITNHAKFILSTNDLIFNAHKLKEELKVLQKICKCCFLFISYSKIVNLLMSDVNRTDNRNTIRIQDGFNWNPQIELFHLKRFFNIFFVCFKIKLYGVKRSEINTENSAVFLFVSF